MTYQALARQWRPKFFRELIGQEHVVQALTHALNQQRLHHAYLFTGTRGVGKTTLARILVKCLNCEEGISAQPCGVCSSCVEIDEGRCIDLIEVDAASRTKVEDTRELLDNVQYKPTRSRYKIYLIDEVHMLSTHSFNALLKTLEEPPEHVKFLLATTDPKKLPITVLSRCLQFTLKSVPAAKVVTYLASLLEQEQITFEEPALWALARAGEGSVRDTLSLTDQAIAFGQGQLVVDEVEKLLGTVDRGRLLQFCRSLVERNLEQGLQLVSEWHEQAISFSQLLADLAGIFHRIAIAQVAPDAIDNSLGDKDAIVELAQQIAVEDIQVFYEIALIGRRDLSLHPDQKMAMDMVLLRLHYFNPVSDLSSVATSQSQAQEVPVSSSLPPVVEMPCVLSEEKKTIKLSDWAEVIPQLNLQGGALNLARHCVLTEITDQTYFFSLSPAYETLKTAQTIQKLEAALHQYLGQAVKAHIQLLESQQATPVQLQAEKQAHQLQAVTEQVHQDPFVQQFTDVFSATIVKDSIKPFSNDL